MGVLYHHGTLITHSSLVNTLTNKHNIYIYKCHRKEHIVKGRIYNYMTFLLVLSYL